MPSAWEIAYLFSAAFPNIVSPAITAETTDEINTTVKSPALSITTFASMLAPAEPDKIPQTSPNTSEQMELTLSAFLTSAIACLLPLTFLDAIAVNVSKLLVVTAKPIISVSTAIPIKTNITITAKTMLALESVNSLITLNEKDKTSAITSTLTGQTQADCFLGLFFDFFSMFLVFCLLSFTDLSVSRFWVKISFDFSSVLLSAFSLFFNSSSKFLLSISSFNLFSFIYSHLRDNFKNNEGNFQGKPCGIGSVGFPNFALVRYQPSGFPLRKTCTESPLRPHYNPLKISNEQPRSFP